MRESRAGKEKLERRGISSNSKVINQVRCARRDEVKQ